MEKLFSHILEYDNAEFGIYEEDHDIELVSGICNSMQFIVPKQPTYKLLFNYTLIKGQLKGDIFIPSDKVIPDAKAMIDELRKPIDNVVKLINKEISITMKIEAIYDDSLHETRRLGDNEMPVYVRVLNKKSREKIKILYNEHTEVTHELRNTVKINKFILIPEFNLSGKVNYELKVNNYDLVEGEIINGEIYANNPLF